MQRIAVERLKLSDRAREAIRERIVSGDYAMGRKLPEAELSDLLGMSKSPIREALLQLESEGLVEMPPDRTARVFTMGAAEIAELAELRQILEREAMQLAVGRNREALVRKLEAVVGRMTQVLEVDDAAAYRRLDQEYHTSLFDLCGNAYLSANYQSLSFRIQALRNRLSRDAVLNRISLGEHVEMLRGIREGDLDRVLGILRGHIADSMANYLAMVGGAHPKSGVGDGVRVSLAAMERFAEAALEAVEADTATIVAVTRALSHASRLGIDTHGYRLLPHYLAAFRGGRLNPRPRLSVVGGRGAAVVLEANDAHGAVACYEAARLAVERARRHGLGAVAVRGSSHFGAAGAYALAIAEAGMMGLVYGNSDAIVRLHGGAAPFHGTNPIAAAAPSSGQRPWLLDMATSAIPFNRVQLARALSAVLPPDVASDGEGQSVTDPGLVESLAPLGGPLFGYKGAGLAGLAEIMAAAFSDAPLGFELPAMVGGPLTTPRRLGAFVMALDPDAFGGTEVFRGVVGRYVTALRNARPAPDARVLAPGDREWEEEERRRVEGIRLDRATLGALHEFAAERSLPPLETVPKESAEG